MAQRRSARRSKRRNLPDFADYDIKITAWSWGYHFGLNHRQEEGDSYWESKHIRIEGHLIGDVGLKYSSGEFTLIPNCNYDRDQRIGAPRPRHVGTIYAYGGTLRGLFDVPNEAVPSLVSVLAANQFRYMLIRGSSLFRRKANVWGYSLETWVAEGDLPTRTEQ